MKPQDWNNAAQVARAFQLGPKESQAVSNLQTKVSKEALEILREATRSRGMRHWINHDMISKDLFNRGFSSGQSGGVCAWVVELTNADDDVLEPCLHSLYFSLIGPLWSEIP